MNCYDDTFDEKKKKQEVFTHYRYLENKKCCSQRSCDKLSLELEDLQFKCDDAFRESNSEVDDKGLTRGTLCEQIKDMKNDMLVKVRSQKGGKKLKSKKRSKKNRKLKNRKTRHNR